MIGCLLQFSQFETLTVFMILSLGFVNKKRHIWYLRYI